MIHGRFIWPGVISPISGTYTISHGIAPGTAVLTCIPQDTPPAESGNLVITDDNNSITIRDCKLDRIRSESDGTRIIWILEILDFRWKWTEMGAIEGWYNQLDPHGKLKPRTIRSPEELAKLCFEAMGITKYRINLPPGLSRKDGENHLTLNPPWLGANSASESPEVIGVQPATGTNPPVNWEGDRPMVALSNLAHTWGRHIIPQLKDYSVLIDIPGQGDDLPTDGSIGRIGPSINSPETPLGVAVLGDYTRYQGRFLLEAVAKDWNGLYYPIKDVSYAPRVENRRQTSQVQIIQPVRVGAIYQITLLWENDSHTEDSSIVFHVATAASTANSIAADLVSQINALDNNDQFSATQNAGTVVISSSANGIAFQAIGATDTANAIVENRATSIASTTNNPWAQSDFANMSIAQSTVTGLGVNVTINPYDNPRLTYQQARDLAKENIFRTYRIRGIDIGQWNQHSGDLRIEVPGYGKIDSKWQLVLTDHQCAQVAPEQRDLNLVEPGSNQPYLFNLYDGFSRDKPAVVYGRIWKGLQTPQWTNNLLDNNTEEGKQIFVNFSVDPNALVVKFSSPVAINRFGLWEEPEKLVLQCAVMVRDKNTNAIDRFKQLKLLAGAKGITKAVVREFRDLQKNVIGHYDSRDNIERIEVMYEQDLRSRANYYLAGMEAQYFQNEGLTIEYNGFRVIDLDGKIQQVTWEFGEGGCKTTASTNTEHEVNVPPYRQRRKAEMLDAVGQENRVASANAERSNPNGSMWVRPPGYEF